jgi:hypothetical protein
MFELSTWLTCYQDFSYTFDTKALLGNNYSFQIVGTGFAEQF